MQHAFCSGLVGKIAATAATPHKNKNKAEFIIEGRRDFLFGQQPKLMQAKKNVAWRDRTTDLPVQPTGRSTAELRQRNTSFQHYA
jgi:hypothetical protein